MPDVAMRVEWVPFGPTAVEALAALVQQAKLGDVLAPVTIVVPTNLVGVALRRALGAVPGGIGAIDVVTLSGLSSRIVETCSDGDGRPVASDQIRSAAIRQALSLESGPLRKVAPHASTANAISEVMVALRRAGPATAALGRSVRPLVVDARRVVTRADEFLGGFWDETDVVRAASGAVSRMPGTPWIVYLPDWLYPAQRQLLQAAALDRTVTLLIGATGVVEADRQALDLIEALAPGTTVAGPDTGATVGATEVISAPDPDEEARTAVRWIAAQIDAGADPARCAILHSGAVPYHRAIRRHLDRAGLESNGPGVSTMGETHVGRVVRAVLTLADQDWSRAAVMALIGAGPVVDADHQVVKPARWDLVSRRAGVVAGEAQWAERLTAWRDSLEPPREGDRPHRDVVMLDELSGFVTRLIGLTSVPEFATWEERAAWLWEAVTALLPPAGLRTDWPDAEAAAFERMEGAVDLLGGLDAIDPDPSAARFRSAVEVELGRAAARHGRAGVGVMTGSYAAAWGVPLDAVALVGAAEGRVPTLLRGGSILGAREHELVGRDLGGVGIDDQYRRYLAALAAAPVRLVTWPRHELRSGRACEPSRWVGPTTTTVESFVASAWAPLPWLSSAELRSAGLIGATELTGPGRHGAASSPWIRSDQRLARGTAMIEARRAGEYGPFTGWAGKSEALTRALGAEFSATSLEDYAQCPARWGFEHVLALRTVDRPETLLEMAPTDRGTLIHRVLEQVVSERIGGTVAGSPEERARARQLLSQEFDRLASLGLTARGALADYERQSLRLQLLGFEQLDDVARQGATAQSAEMAFGVAAGRPVSIVTPSGRALRFKGSVDRVDGSPTHRVVIDYKSGRPKSRDLTPELLTGQKLQPVLYALAVEQASPGPPVDQAAYWHLSPGAPELVPVDLEAARDGALEAIDDLVTTIEHGHFPARPGEATSWPRPGHEHCSYCAFDPICPSSRSETWQILRSRPELATYRMRVEGVDPASDGPASDDHLGGHT